MPKFYEHSKIMLEAGERRRIVILCYAPNHGSSLFLD